MRRYVLLTMSMLAAGPASAAMADPIRIELNALDPTDAGCRLSFVIENKNARALEALRTDLAVFDRAGAVQRRMLVDFGPVRQAKTIIKSFVIEQKCDEVGSVLVNDVSLCTPLDRDACIDALDLTSRIEAVRLYK